MSGYVAAINYIGPAYTAIISAMFPALGVLLSYIFLKEKMKPIQIIGLIVSIIGIIILGYTPGANQVTNLPLGFDVPFYVALFGLQKLLYVLMV